MLFKEESITQIISEIEDDRVSDQISSRLAFTMKTSVWRFLSSESFIMGLLFIKEKVLNIDKIVKENL